jgi:hypothetical protein
MARRWRITIRHKTTTTFFADLDQAKTRGGSTSVAPGSSIPTPGSRTSRISPRPSAMRLAAAKIWSGWEGATSKLLPDSAFAGHYEEDEFALAFARKEAHYFVNKGFFETDDQLLCNASRIRHNPIVIAQCRYDDVCPMERAWALHRAWPEADLISLPTAATTLSIYRTALPWSPLRTNLRLSVSGIPLRPGWLVASAMPAALRCLHSNWLPNERVARDSDLFLRRDGNGVLGDYSFLVAYCLPIVLLRTPHSGNRPAGQAPGIATDING